MSETRHDGRDERRTAQKHDNAVGREPPASCRPTVTCQRPRTTSPPGLRIESPTRPELEDMHEAAPPEPSSCQALIVVDLSHRGSRQQQQAANLRRSCDRLETASGHASDRISMRARNARYSACAVDSGLLLRRGLSGRSGHARWRRSPSWRLLAAAQISVSVPCRLAGSARISSPSALALRRAVTRSPLGEEVLGGPGRAECAGRFWPVWLRAGIG